MADAGGGGGGGGEEDPSNPTPTNTAEVSYYQVEGGRATSISGALEAAGLEEDPNGNVEVMMITHVFQM